MRKLKRNYLQKRLGKGCGKEVLRQRLSGPGRTNFVGGASAVALALLALVILSPTVSEGANAETSSMALPLEVQNHQMLSLGLSDNKVAMEVTPNATDTFSAADVNFTVSTNAVDGYKLYIGMLDDSKTALVNEADGSSATIPSISTATVGANLPVNHWGYSLERGKVTVDHNTTFSKIPKATDVADSQHVKSQDYTLGFATRINSQLDAGVYRNTMTISAVTNPVTISNLNQLVYMQDMTSAICQNTLGTDGKAVSASLHNEPSRQLVDTRDGKVYWVSKLADQNCWMVQNLDLDIPATPSTEFINQSDNIAAGWKPTAGTRTGNLDLNNANVNYSSSYSWDVGNYVLKNPTDDITCSGIPAGGNLSSCNRVELYNGTQDSHYKIGNYYQWNAAAVGTEEKVNVSASGSICPKNWQLPGSDKGLFRTATEIASDSNYERTYGKTFTKLLTDYGFSFPVGTAPSIYGDNSQNGYDLNLKPFYFARIGYIEPSYSLSEINIGSFYWSNMISNAIDRSYEFSFNNARAYPNFPNPRIFGFAVRCVAR